MPVARHAQPRAGTDTVRIGLDLGTCCSRVGYADPHGVSFVPDPTAGGVMSCIPSSALVGADGGMAFGVLAESAKSARPQGYDAEFIADLTSTSYPVSLASGIRDQLEDVPAADLTRPFLRFLVEAAATTVNAGSIQAVVTMPAAADPVRRSSVLQAALAAGLTDLRLVSDPVAAVTAAIEDGELPGTDLTVLVYHLGAAHFEAAVVRVQGTGHEVIGSRGLTDAGGTQLDRMIEQDLVDHAGDGLAELLAGARSEDPAALQRALRTRIAVRDLCRDIKHRLSSADLVVTDLNLASSYRLGRDDLEALARPQLKRTVATCRELLAQLSLPTEAVSGILLVGGASRMPLVARMVDTELERPIWRSMRPELAVCAGAALLARARPAGPAPNTASSTVSAQGEATSEALDPAPASPPWGVEPRAYAAEDEQRLLLLITDSVARGVVSALDLSRRPAPRGTSEPDRAAIVHELNSLRVSTDVHFAPDIPPGKLARARASTGAPADADVLALIDMTVFHRAKDAILFTEDTLYYRHIGSWPSKTIAIAYCEIPSEVSLRKGKLMIFDQKYQLSGTNVPGDLIVDLLRRLRSVALGE